MVVVSGVRRGSMSLLSVFFLVAALLTALPGTARAAAADPLVGSVGPTGLWTVPGADPFYFGLAGDIPFLGDFNGDGVRTPGLYRPTTGLAYVRNTLDTGVADLSWFIGDPGDQPLVGDFDGDGTDSFGIYRDGVVHLRNAQTTGVADVSYSFGNPGDVAFAGDFDGNGIDTVGVHRPSTGQVFLSNSQVTSVADEEFFFGDPNDLFVSGDWDGDGIDTVAVVRPSADMFFFRNTNDLGVANGQVGFDGSSMPVVPYQVLPDTVTLTTELSGAAEVPAGSGDADGTGSSTITIAGLTLSWTITVKDIDAPSAAHIHSGTAIEAGPVVHDLLGNGGPFVDDGMGGLVASGMLTITAEQAAALAASPGAFYVNVHNPAFPAGAVRGNLSRSVMVELVTGLSGAAEVPAGSGDADGTGSSTITIAGLTLSWTITVAMIDPPTAAHIHSGTAIEAGPVVHDLLGNGGPFVDDGMGGLVASGMLTITAEQAAALAASPGAFYVNVHNPAFPAGAVRGNLM